MICPEFKNCRHNPLNTCHHSEPHELNFQCTSYCGHSKSGRVSPCIEEIKIVTGKFTKRKIREKEIMMWNKDGI